MSAPQQDRSVRTRQALVDGAARLFADQGYYGASIEKITEASGVKKGAIYHHFANKEALAEAVLQEGLVLEMPDPNLLPRVQAVVDTSISLAVLLPQVPVVRAASRLATEPGTPFYRRLWDNYIPYAEHVLKEAWARDELVPWADPAEAARMWVGAWTGEDIMHRPNPEDLPKAIERVNKSIANMYATKETHIQLKLSVAHGEALTAGHPKLVAALAARAVLQGEVD